MELLCIECAVAIKRPGKTGPRPKRCADCNRLRRNAQRRDRYQRDPAAAVASVRQWQLANPEKKKATAAAWYLANRDQQNLRRREWATGNPGRDWAAYLNRKYNLSLSRYEAMLAEQGGVCGIPGCSETEGRPGQPLQVDHDHACCPGVTSCGGCIRGLLCGRHNAGLGLFRDDIGALCSAAAYLQHFGLKAVS